MKSTICGEDRSKPADNSSNKISSESGHFLTEKISSLIGCGMIEAKGEPSGQAWWARAGQSL